MNDYSWIGIVIGCFVGLAGWLVGRDKKISTEAEWKGSINSKLDTLLGIKSEVCELRDKVNTHSEKIAVHDDRISKLEGRK